ncbi:MAG: hypothetical protein Q4C38_00515 [bacterium]|nr:hypothetical protein [bacterium]
MINKITIKNGAKIIDNNYVIKKKKRDLSNTYNYLLSRSFDYFPEVVKEDNEKIYYRYINDLEEPKEQKVIDLVNLITLLHSKTTFYKEVDIDNYKYIYESINNSIDETLEHYNQLMDGIESEVYMAPSNYLIARNITIIYNALGYAKNNINSWYKMIENQRKVRVVTIHNNLRLEHYLKEDKPYLISWDKSKIDMPIFDLISLYQNNYLDFEFIDLLKIYLSKYPLTREEMTLFLTIISIPGKIPLNESEYQTVLSVRRILDYIYKSSEIVKIYDGDLKDQNNQGKKMV